MSDSEQDKKRNKLGYQRISIACGKTLTIPSRFCRLPLRPSQPPGRGRFADSVQPIAVAERSAVCWQTKTRRAVARTASASRRNASSTRSTSRTRTSLAPRAVVAAWVRRRRPACRRPHRTCKQHTATALDDRSFPRCRRPHRMASLECRSIREQRCKVRRPRHVAREHR